MPLDSGTKDDIETHLANGIPEVDTERLSGAHVFASGYDAELGAACQAALDEYGDDPSVVHLDVEVPALDTAAPLEIPSHTVVYIEADITLAADTAENILQSADAFTQSTGTGGSEKAQNVHVVGAGGTLDGAKANQTAGSDGFKQACVHMYADGSSVRGVRARDAAWHNISVVGDSTDVRISGNNCQGAGASQIQCHYRSEGGDDGDGALVSAVVVKDNVCVGGDNTGSIRLAGCERSSVVDNVVRDHTAAADNHGIRVYQGDYPESNAKDVTVRGNAIDNVSGNGILVDSSSEDDTLGAHGDVTVSGNNLNDVGGDGIVFHEGQVLVVHGSVDANNVHDGAGDGVVFNGTVLGVVVSDNVITSNAGTAVSISGTGADENLYDGNVARGNGTDSLSGTGTNSVVGDNVGL